MNRLREAVSVMVYFFIAFVLLGITRDLMREESGMLGTTLLSALAGAVLVAAAIMLVDVWAFMEPFPKTPVIYNACWKTLVYIQVVFALEVVREYAPLYLRHENLGPALDRLLSPRFLFLQVWLVILMGVYWMYRGLIQAIGPEHSKDLFWRSRSHP